MPEFDLDSFKKTWQEQPVQKKYDDNEILKMLNRKSRNYVKYIFWISVAEFLLFSVMGIFYFFQNDWNWYSRCWWTKPTTSTANQYW